MAAGLGFKTFTTGEVLTSTDVNGYLMQGVLVFASAAARNAAITSPQEGQFAYTKDTNGLWYYDGAAWVASGATGDIEGVTAGVGISGGGTSGTVTITNSMATEITAAGDIIVGTGSGTFDNLPIGTTAQVLTADTTVSPYKVKWATPTGATSGPAFAAYRTSNATISTNTWVKVPWNTEYFDTGSCYDSSTNYRFTPTTAGIYQINISHSGNGNVNGAIYKNGSNYLQPSYSTTGQYASGSTLISMNGSTDYLEMYVYSSGATLYGTAVEGGFSGAYIRSN